MLTKPITYENYNGEKKTKNFYFHLTKMEIARLQAEYEGGLSGYLKKIVESDDTREIFKFFEEIVLMSYGEKSADGEEFLKSQEIRDRFKCHPAYDVFMLEMIAGGDKTMGDFIKAIVPNDMAEAINKADSRSEVNKLVGFEVVPENKN